MFAGCSRGVRGVFSGCSQGVRGVFAGCSRGVRGVFAGCSRGVRGVFAGCSRGVRRVFAGCSRGVRGVFAGCSRGVRPLKHSPCCIVFPTAAVTTIAAPLPHRTSGVDDDPEQYGPRNSAHCSEEEVADPVAQGQVLGLHRPERECES